MILYNITRLYNINDIIIYTTSYNLVYNNNHMRNEKNTSRETREFYFEN